MTREKQNHSNQTSYNYTGRYIMALLLSALAGAGIFAALYMTGAYLGGREFYGQLFALDAIKDAMQNGRLYPLYAGNWYRGYEIFRSSPPVPYILIVALIQAVGETHTGICLFYAVCASVAMLGFFGFGIYHKRMAGAAVTGAAYLLLPVTTEAALFQVNFGVVMGLAILPGLFYCLYRFLLCRNRIFLGYFSILLAGLILSHYVLAFVFGIFALFYALLTALLSRDGRLAAALFADIILTYTVLGLFLYPALSAGILSRAGVASNWEVPFGGILLGAGLLGLFTADKKRFTGFFLCTVGAALSFAAAKPVLRLLPYAALRSPFWYLLLASVICLITLLSWRKLRFFWLLALLAFLTLPGIKQLWRMEDGEAALMKVRTLAEDYFLPEAAAMTASRAALLDASELGAFPQWYFAVRGVDSLTGWDVEGAERIREQSCLEEAFADGFYGYLFDRLRLYGNDVVIVPKERLTEKGALAAMKTAAQQCGYETLFENTKAVLFKESGIESRYGVITQYKNLAIGDHASYIAYIYPDFGLGNSDCLEDYTVEELAGYEVLYLSGFTCRDQKQAANLLRALADKGVRIFIDMQHIPVNTLTGKNEFMGVYAQTVQFTDRFPILQNENGNEFKLDEQIEGIKTWNTVYISGCSEVLKETSYDGRRHLVYLGQNGSPQITFMGLNLVYYYLSTHDADLLRFLNETLLLSPGELPMAELAEVEKEEKQDMLVLHTDKDHVNSGVAVAACLTPDRILHIQDGMWVIDSGETTFEILPADRTGGVITSILGIVLLGILWISVYVLLEDETAASEDA